MTKKFSVIIVGGGPVGAALGIELGLHQIETLILEKHEEPLLSPRAQSLSERSMEFMVRWGLAETLRAQNLFSPDFPMRGVWCSKLNGITYATASSGEQFSENIVAQKAIRLPLYLTENILREKLKTFPCVTFLKNREGQSVKVENHRVTVTANNRLNQTIETYQADYAIACDGANSTIRENAQLSLQALAPKRRVINLLFESTDLATKITVEKGFLYYLLGNATIAAIGVVDPGRSIWYAQIFYQGDEQDITKVDVSHLLELVTGVQFAKNILNKHFWDMQIKCADHFAKDNHIFLVGDAAHAFAPTGGLGLNTGLGDVTNLAWKLAAVIQKQASPNLLKTYELERRPICLINLAAAERNATDAAAVRTQFPPATDPLKFAEENARIAKQHSHSGGLTLGYTYDPKATPMKAAEYVPTVKPGYFLPHQLINGSPLYEKLSPTHWTLIVCGKEKIKFHSPLLKILHLPESTYEARYLLIRPDWHIALLCNLGEQDLIIDYLEQVKQQGILNN